MLTHSHILIVEDDPVASATLAAYLSREGCRVSAASDGATMRQIFPGGAVDLILLDISLPGDDGFSLLREIRRQSEIGVIMVTSKGDDVDRIVALELGADDYVTKPFNMRELFARSKNLLRRTQALRRLRQDEPSIHFSGWVLNVPRRTLISPAGGDVRLTRFEFELLLALARNPGCVLSRDRLLDHIGSTGHSPNDRTVDVLIGRIRRKIEAEPKIPRIVITVQGVGYVLTG